MTRFLIRLVIVVMFGCACMVLLAIGVGQVLVLPDNELVFNANLRSGNSDLYRMDIAHRLIYPITKDLAVDTQPIWSPDGQQIAFDSNRDGQYTVYVMDAYGGKIHPLRNDASYAYGPSWSPDGRYIVYITTQFPISPELMLMDLRSGTTRRLTDNRQPEDSPNWSPDGRHLAFAYNIITPRFKDIFNLDIQTGDLNPLFVTSDNKHSPNWSSDGRSVLYVASESNPGIYIWDIAHAQSTLVYAHEGLNVYDPNWSPDGRFVVYAPLTSNNNNHIFVLDVTACLQQPNSCTPQALPLIPGIYADPRWRPRTS